MTDAAPARKPPWLLLAPVFLLALSAIAWTGAWFWLSGRTTAGLDNAAAALERGGYRLTWASRRVEGYPFRLKLRLTEARFASKSGRALAVPRLDATAAAYQPGKWVFVIPEGLTLERPLQGPTRVTGRGIRGSVVATARGPRAAIEGRDLVFTPAGGAILFPIARAGRFEAQYAPRPDGPDEAGLLVRLDDAVAAQGTLLQRLGGQPQGRLLWESVVEEASDFRGADWGAAVRHWTDAGGALRVVQAQASVGDAAASVTRGRLTVGTDGRLRGSLDLAVRQAPRSLLTLRGVPKVDEEAASQAAVVAEAREDDALARLTLVFEAGVATVGPVALAPAPKIW